MLGADLLDRPRHGRIRLRGRWLHFPLKPVDLALNLPSSFMLGVMRDSILRPRNGNHPPTFATTLEQGLGRTICRDFYFPYAEKIWGVSPAELDVEQARRRVSANSLLGMVRKVAKMVPVFKTKGAGRFFYPQGGYGRITEAYSRDAAERGVTFAFGSGVTKIRIKNGRAMSVVTRADDQESEHTASQVLSTIPLPVLANAIRPEAPDDVLQSAKELKYRAMILVFLALETDRFSEYDAHYFPGPEIAISRLSEPKNYGLSGKPGATVLCAELPCADSDPVWSMTDGELGRLVTEALEAAALPVRVPVASVTTRRVKQAYPIYTQDFRRHFEKLDNWVSQIDGLVTFGRQGLFAHDNTHHALAMAYALDDSIGSSGNLDRERWDRHRRAFEAHVVED